MAKMSEMFASRWMKPEHMAGDETYTIDRVATEEFTNDGTTEKKWVVFFRETDQGLVLNKTRATAIAENLGDDTDRWIGQPITLHPAKVAFKGAYVPTIAVRVAFRHPANASANAQQRATAPQVAENRNSKISAKQVGRFRAIAKANGWTDGELGQLTGLAGFERLEDITTDKYDGLCDQLEDVVVLGEIRGDLETETKDNDLPF